jgi:LysM domain
MPARDRLRRRARASILMAGAILAAVGATGCLPTGTRGEGQRPASADVNRSPAVTASPGPTGPTPRPSFVPPTPTPEPTFLVYVVKKGDSLNTIAHKFGTTARSIAFWNRATYPSLDPESAHYRPDLLKLGWTLFLRPNDVVDEQELPEPSSSADDQSEAPADETTIDADPSGSAVPE